MPDWALSCIDIDTGQLLSQCWVCAWPSQKEAALWSQISEIKVIRQNRRAQQHNCGRAVPLAQLYSVLGLLADDPTMPL